MDDQEGSPWLVLLGLPTIIGLPAFIVIASAIGGLEGVLIGLFAGFLALIVIGFAMTVAKRL